MRWTGGEIDQETQDAIWANEVDQLQRHVNILFALALLLGIVAFVLGIIVGQRIAGLVF